MMCFQSREAAQLSYTRGELLFRIGSRQKFGYVRNPFRTALLEGKARLVNGSLVGVQMDGRSEDAAPIGQGRHVRAWSGKGLQSRLIAIQNHGEINRHRI